MCLEKGVLARPLILNVEVDARIAKQDEDFTGMARAAGIRDDVVQTIQFDRWGRVFNERVRNHLRLLNIHAATDRAIEMLQKEGLVGSQGQFANDKLSELRKHATHVISTRFVPVGRPDRCGVIVTYKDLTRGLFGDELSMDATINIEDLYPDFKRIYRPSKPLISNKDIVQVQIEGEQKLAQIVESAPNEQGGQPKVRQPVETVPNEKDPQPKVEVKSGDKSSVVNSDDRRNALVRVITDGSFALASHAASRVITRDDISSDYVDTLHQIASTTASILAPPSGSVISVDRDSATVSNSANAQMKKDDRLTVRRTVETSRGIIEDSICESRVLRVDGTQATISVPDGVQLDRKCLVYGGHRERLNLVVYPLELLPIQDVNVKQEFKSNCEMASRKFAQDLSQTLTLYGVPLLADIGLVKKIDEEFQRPGLNKELSVQSGNRIGATHVLSGTMTAYIDKGSDTKSAKDDKFVAEIDLQLTELETTRTLPFAKVKVPGNLGREEFDYGRTIDLMSGGMPRLIVPRLEVLR